MATMNLQGQCSYCPRFASVFTYDELETSAHGTAFRWLRQCKLANTNGHHCRDCATRLLHHYYNTRSQGAQAQARSSAPSNFACAHCQQMFSSAELQAYNSHIDNNTCLVCAARFTCQGMVRQHLLGSTCGGRPGLRHCGTCRKELTEGSEFEDHTRKAQCAGCMNAFTCVVALRNHRCPFTCPYCRRPQMSLEAFHHHTQIQLCDDCPNLTKFLCRGLLERHRQELQLCNHCGDKLHPGPDQTLHFELNHCTFCGLRFACQKLLTKHPCVARVAEVPRPPEALPHTARPPPPLPDPPARTLPPPSLPSTSMQILPPPTLPPEMQPPHSAHPSISKPEAADDYTFFPSQAQEITTKSCTLIQCLKCHVFFMATGRFKKHLTHKDCRNITLNRVKCQYCDCTFANKTAEANHAKSSVCNGCEINMGCSLALLNHELEFKGTCGDATSPSSSVEIIEPSEPPSEVPMAAAEDEKEELKQIIAELGIDITEAPAGCGDDPEGCSDAPTHMLQPAELGPSTSAEGEEDEEEEYTMVDWPVKVEFKNEPMDEITIDEETGNEVYSSVCISLDDN